MTVFHAMLSSRFAHYAFIMYWIILSVGSIGSMIRAPTLFVVIVIAKVKPKRPRPRCYNFQHYNVHSKWKTVFFFLFSFLENFEIKIKELLKTASYQLNFTSIVLDRVQMRACLTFTPIF